MANVKLIAQGLVENNDHALAVRQVLNDNVDEILVSVAFARKGGVELIAECLEKNKDKCHIYLGVRNGVTSIQAVLELLKAGVSPYLIDIASSRRIYHPKIYASFTGENAEIILGSANLTIGGLNQNYEASSILSLDSAIDSDKEYIEAIRNAFFSLEEQFPDHVTQVSTPREAIRFLRNGLLEDERIARLVAPKKTKGIASTLKPMPSTAKKLQPLQKAVEKVHLDKFEGSSVLVWESKELTERDLNIPTGANTNRTGSMYFKKGLMDSIDQRHYFRDVVFGDLDWQPDPSPSKHHLERAEAAFEIVIKGVSHGIHLLRLTHNSRTDTPTYKQNNAMTQVHWGEIIDLLARRVLLGELLTLHRMGYGEYRMTIG